MLLADVVETSGRVAGTSKRLAKIELLADLLKQLQPAEIEVVVSFLSGGTRQGRAGVGYAVVRDSQAPPAATATLEVLDVDRALAALAAVKGRGSEQQKRDRLQSLMGLATVEEQQFLKELLLGGLRQGALEGLMFEALAKASGGRAGPHPARRHDGRRYRYCGAASCWNRAKRRSTLTKYSSSNRSIRCWRSPRPM